MEYRIKDICKERGITYKEMATMLGTSDIALRASLRGNPTMRTLEKVAEILNVEVVDLFKPREGAKMSCPYCGRTIDIQAHRDEKEA